MREFEVADKVRVVYQGSSRNPEGSVRIVTEVEGQKCLKVSSKWYSDLRKLA
jgi:hypothetical protein